MPTTVPLKDSNNNNNTTTTTTTPIHWHVPASHLARPATPEQAQHQKRIMIGAGLVYAIVVGVTVLLLVHKWLGSHAGLGASLGQVMGYGGSPVLLWAVGRVTGLTVGFRPKNHHQKNPPVEQQGGDGRTANAETTQADNVVAVVDVAIEGPSGNHLALQNDTNTTVPQPLLFYRMASQEETKQQTILLLKYGIVFCPLGIAPLVVLVSWQGSFLPDAIGCMIGYVAGSLYYPVMLWVVSYSTGQRLLWMHRRRVRLIIAEDCDSIINHQGKSHAVVPQGKSVCENV